MRRLSVWCGEPKGAEMLVVISPAKRLDRPCRNARPSRPRFQREANILAGHARQSSVADLKRRMGLSDDPAHLNRDRFRAMTPESTFENSRPAALAFAGDTTLLHNSPDGRGSPFPGGPVPRPL